jgi:hypothetical protein
MYLKILDEKKIQLQSELILLNAIDLSKKQKIVK